MGGISIDQNGILYVESSRDPEESVLEVEFDILRTRGQTAVDTLANQAQTSNFLRKVILTCDSFATSRKQMAILIASLTTTGGLFLEAVSQNANIEE